MTDKTNITKRYDPPQMKASMDVSVRIDVAGGDDDRALALADVLHTAVEDVHRAHLGSGTVTIDTILGGGISKWFCPNCDERLYISGIERNTGERPSIEFECEECGFFGTLNAAVEDARAHLDESSADDDDTMTVTGVWAGDCPECGETLHIGTVETTPGERPRVEVECKKCGFSEVSSWDKIPVPEEGRNDE